MNDTQNQYGNFQTLEIRKADLINILKTNLEKHNILYNISLSGYFEDAKKYLQSYINYSFEHSKYLNNLTGIYNKTPVVLGEKLKPIKLPYWTGIIPREPTFPVSYASYYEDTIKKLELSIRPIFSLNETEFQSYVQNNWSWKQDFISNTQSLIANKSYYTNESYYTNITGGALLSCSGMLNNF